MAIMNSFKIVGLIISIMATWFFFFAYLNMHNKKNVLFNSDFPIKNTKQGR